MGGRPGKGICLTCGEARLEHRTCKKCGFSVCPREAECACSTVNEWVCPDCGRQWRPESTMANCPDCVVRKMRQAS